MTLRGRLLLALAYILLLAIVALEVPLAISLRDRVDAEVRSQARSQADVVAATVAFDHFSRQLSRPEEGPHYLRDQLFNDPVLRSNKDGDDYGAGTDFGSFGGTKNSPVLVQIPNGSTGYLKDVGFGGHPLENANSESNGALSTVPPNSMQ